jgi:diadenylate cyclase
VDEIVLAATTLARSSIGRHRGHGARDGPAQLHRDGHRPRRALTYDLLISIFNPRTPLHDGAVVVQGNRIAAAACFLPLTVNPALSRTLGSRHRAAIGVTEDTDAVAVVVSEETGTISLVAGGRIRREYDGPR